MLTQLTINNFAIVRDLEIDFRSGMTTITGETGAGKSIAIDALGLCLGSRGDANMVRPGAQRADLCARFSLVDADMAAKWLIEHELDNQSECLLRRTITLDGRSRGFINGTAVPLSQLRELGALLIQIHGQHAHQLLLDNNHQKSLLDAYANQQERLLQMKHAWQKWHDSCQQLAMFQKQMQERESRQQLLDYHLKELAEFSPVQGEFESIEQEYKQLANYGQFLTLGQNAMQIMSESDDANILSLLNSAKHELAELASLDTKFSSLLDMLEEASIQVSEASDELRHYCDQYELDPNRLYELEQRISKQISLARKHHIMPEALPELYQQLLDEQEKIANQNEDCEMLSEQVHQDHQHAMACAQELHQIRLEYAQELSQLITNSMHQLSMPHGRFTIDVKFTPEHLQPDGASKVEFNVTTNPGQPHQALAKVASGGELSRIALAIQVITAKKMDTPALIFDEVDVGISGPTAAIVGRLLRELGESTQVMCVTHLPQVAGCGHHHFYVSKETNGIETETHMQLLDKKSRLQELARLLAGSEVTKNTLANAKELLAA
ncbi:MULTISPECIES: DNA repair protein RecN [Providencia]|uniref:DNA repair protein RecN n=1 Tax=Providencia stuartii TaxID=588 RepID=A0AAJ1JGJ7_PROST|nr:MULTISPECIES: DNA repair protein RecN [Providencia]AIN62412.1 DNA repair protein RecN [Providencia stuartii]EMA3642110.1 DNA repair protein RecN [Providencia stuartii]EMF0916622.1 DNA repair protein RecN [Providencia stuartii]KNZ84829.1 recombination and repair protein [Providencia stuartii]MBG5894993.1 DNA repair protein RecN [Providencia stuartii]